MIVNKYANGGGGSTSGVTPQDVQQQINSALTPYWESGETKDYVDSAVSGISLDGYYTSAQTQEAIAEAVEGYATSGDMQSAFTLISETQRVAAAGLNQLEGRIDELSGATPDLSAYYTSAQTDAAIAQAVSGLATEQYVQDALSGVNMDNYYTSAQTEDAISAATSGKADAANVSGNTSNRYFPAWNEQGIITGITDTVPVRTGYLGINGTGFTIYSRNISLGNIYGPQSAGTAGDILVSTGKGAPVWSAVTMGGGNSNILAAITTQAEYEAISGDVKTGDLIEVEGVDINGDNEPEYGLFGANVQEEEDGGVVRKSIYWNRRDNGDSITWSFEDYPWMADNDVNPIDINSNSFLIAPDVLVEDEAYNGIGFDIDGKPVITHFSPQYDDETGEVTGITREDTPIAANLSAYWTSAETKTYVNDKVVSAETQVAQSFANLDTNVIQPMQGDIQELSGITEEIQDNFSAYTPTSGFSTINGSAITNGGNIVISGPDVSNYVTSAQVETQIVEKNYVTSAQVETQMVAKNYITSADTANFVTSAQVETQIVEKNYVNSGDVKSQVEAYNYATVSQIPTVPTSNTAFTNDAGYITDAAIENLVTSAQVETQIDTKAAAYTPTSGFSTINGSAITNGGNIVIEGGADMSAYYTSAQTDAAIAQAVSGLATEQYVQDALSGVSLEGYYTSAQTEDAITSKNYITSAQVETQIVSKNYITSAEIADFVTSAQVETQITSKGYATVSQIPTVPTSNTAFTNDAGYVTSAQVETQIVEKNYITSAAIANMVTSTYVSTIWRGTQSDYDAIPTKDPNTFYIIL